MRRLGETLSSIGALTAASRRLRRDEWLPPGELARLRRDRLRRVLSEAAGAPFYRAALREAGLSAGELEPGDLPRLPIVDREVMAREGLEAFLTVPATGLIATVTSGSTGTPGRFLRSRKEEAEYSARWMRVYRAYGCGVRDGQVNLAGTVRPDRAGGIAILRRLGLLPRIERMFAATPAAQVLERVQALEPPILTGYAGAIEALAEHVLATGARITPPRAVFCTAMEVTDRCLEISARAFRAPAVDVYVTNELGVLAWSCPVRRDLLHFNDDCFVLEVLDGDGRPAAEGAVGELVITSLGLTSMPLIRYRMGDMAARAAGTCGCGRGLGLMTRVQGRTAHAIPRPGGGVIVTPIVTGLFGRASAYEWVRAFQVREEPGARLRMLLDARRPPSEEQRRALQESLESELGDFSIELELVDRIPPAPSGKLQFLVPLPRARVRG
jgi:phenylacetate-CoA ligase